MTLAAKAVAKDSVTKLIDECMETASRTLKTWREVARCTVERLIVGWGWPA